MIIRRLFTHDEVVAALAQVALKERNIQLAPGTHQADCKMLVMAGVDGALHHAVGNG